MVLSTTLSLIMQLSSPSYDNVSVGGAVNMGPALLVPLVLRLWSWSGAVALSSALVSTANPSRSYEAWITGTASPLPSAGHRSGDSGTKCIAMFTCVVPPPGADRRSSLLDTVMCNSGGASERAWSRTGCSSTGAGDVDWCVSPMTRKMEDSAGTSREGLRV